MNRGKQLIRFINNERREAMGKNLFFKALHVCFAVFLFCGLTGCGVDVFISNQTQDNLNIASIGHVMQGETKRLCVIQSSRDRDFRISRSYGDIAVLYVSCPKGVDISETPDDTIVITEPQYNVLRASAEVLTVSIQNLMNPTGENGDMPSEDLLEDTEEEPAEDLMGES